MDRSCASNFASCSAVLSATLATYQHWLLLIPILAIQVPVRTGFICELHAGIFDSNLQEEPAGNALEHNTPLQLLFN